MKRKKRQPPSDGDDEEMVRDPSALDDPFWQTFERLVREHGPVTAEEAQALHERIQRAKQLQQDMPDGEDGDH